MSIFTDTNFLTELSFDMPGAYHMACDLELAEKLRDDPNAQNVLRLYSWKPYCISLGYQQDDSSIDKDACSRAGIDIVRRPTGGRAVYHAEELTYAVIMRFEPGEGIYAVHNKIAESLLEMLQPICNNELELTDGRPSVRQTSVRPDSADGLKSVPLEDSVHSSFREAYKPGTLTNIACFTSTARYEITWRGRKVVGSAQRRFGNAVLQHGSILLGNEHLRLPEFLKISEEEKLQMKQMLKDESATVSEICGSELSSNDVVESMLKNTVIVDSPILPQPRVT